MDLLAIGISAAICALIAPGALKAFREAGWVRSNYRGVEVPFPAGVIAVVASVLTLGIMGVIGDRPGMEFLVLFGALDRLPRGAFTDLAHVFAPLFVGVALLGVLDDLFEGEPRGWRGHFGAVLRGGFSTGALKAVGTGALAVFVMTAFDASTGEIALAVVVIALATNLFNLLDLRPGRSWKVFVLLGAGLLLADGDTYILRVIGPFAGALLVLGLLDLRERAMLGDTGSNLLGAIAGVWMVLTLDTTGQIAAAATMLALTIFGEFRSFTAAIDRLPPLRVLDSLGRRDA